MNKLQKHVAQAIAKEQYEFTKDGGLLVKGGVKVEGTYVEGVNGGDWREHKNLIPDAGILYLLGAALGGVTPITAWYVAPFAAAVTPAANWTASNFAATASEITSPSEGYSQSTRVAWTPGAASAGQIDNLAAKASFTIVTASSLTINGAGILSASAKGSTSGTLVSASKFSTARVVYDTDTWDCGYYVKLLDS